MITLNGINTASNINFSQKTSEKTQYKKPNYKMYSFLQDEKITFGEGTGLLLYGVLAQGKELILSILEHPLKTAAIIGGTTLGLMALPFIGIPTAVGGGILAAGFAAISLGKAVIHTAEFIKHNKKGSYDIARLNLEQLGQDTFDSALSVPFVPKAITNIKSFSKFGKINLNSELISQLKNTKKLSEKLSTLKTADKELSRNINFQYAAEKELSQFKTLTKSEKEILRKELLEFNVPAVKIPDVVLDKWAEIRGISTKPDIKYESLPQNTKAVANAAECSITMNDYKRNITADFSNFKLLSQNLKDNEYIITYKNTKNGSTIVETIQKEILDKYNQLCYIHQTLSSQASKILTLIHEREHIHQFALMSKLQGLDWLKNCITNRGRYLFTKMIDEINNSNQSINSKRVLSYFERSKSGTPVSYIKETLEIDAREMEYKTLENPIFQLLNKIFKRTNKTKNISIEKNILLNDARIETAA